MHCNDLWGFFITLLPKLSKAIELVSTNFFICSHHQNDSCTDCTEQYNIPDEIIGHNFYKTEIFLFTFEL